MIGKIAGYAGMLVVAGLLAQTMVTTQYLAKIDKGLNSSLQSTSTLVSIEGSIIKKNQALSGVVDTTKQMSKNLNATLAVSQAIDGHIHLIDKYNADTLGINRQLVGLGSSSGQTLQGVSSNMSQLAHATQSLGNSISTLDQLIQQDRKNLDQMKTYADEMNNKTPGVPG
ncbi:hypothetical protein LLE49_04325 [Alicyclobacillus tolerans]|uniref:hypothetical protein n=1 Tax=Alicyclobacillus tolerans TaxID=90970 RepID=UPI001F3D1AC9|nr:hypothetical protein [Alicyclobacillus tolerans]MCF8563962.1 hypothetical protein [Alicyclobacillus tolerans]